MSFDITDTVIDQSGEKGSDFTLVNTDKIDDIFNGIEVKLNYYIDLPNNDTIIIPTNDTIINPTNDTIINPTNDIIPSNNTSLDHAISP